MRIAMTGATSGIGLAAARYLLRANATLTVGVRSPAAVPSVLKRGAQLKDLDLASLDSARRFAASLSDGPPLDALVLNAGVQCVKREVSRDGYELTFAVNHLAHYLLIRLLTSHLAPDARVVVTTSGTHDPAAHTMIPPPRHADAKMLARPDTDPGLDKDPMRAGRRAYSTSKLCNVMTARTLAARLKPNRPDVAVIAFDPGLTPGTGLARNYSTFTGLIFKYVMPWTSRNATTPEVAGRLLADLILSPDYRTARGDYYRVHNRALGAKQPSTLARDDAACAALWTDSAALIGLAD